MVSLRFWGATAKGAEWLSLRSSGIPGGGDFSVQVLVRDGRSWTNVGGGWQSGPVPSGLGSGATFSSTAFHQLARYVKDVRVTEHQLIGGKPVVAIGGEIAGSPGGGLGELSAEPPGRAGRSDAASSVASMQPLSTLPTSLPRNAQRTPATSDIPPGPPRATLGA